MEVQKFAFRTTCISGKVEDNLSQLTTWVNGYVDQYKGLIVNEETRPAAKKDLAEIRKVKTACEEERKTLKKVWMMPYEEWLKRYEAALSPILDLEAEISTQIKALDDAETARRVEARKSILADMAAASEIPVFDWMWSAQWENKSFLETAFKREAKALIDRVAADLQVIRDDHDTDLLLLEYRKHGNLSLSISTVRESKKYLQTAVQEPEISQEDREVIAILRVIRGPKYKLREAIKVLADMGLEVSIPQKKAK